MREFVKCGHTSVFEPNSELHSLCTTDAWT